MVTNLVATTEKLQVELGGAITTLELTIDVTYVDLLSSDQSLSAVGAFHGVTSGATPVDVVAAPASGHTRTVQKVSVYNRDSVAATVTIEVNVSGTKYIITKETINAGDTLVLQ
jgi:hypothetical protein